MRHALDSSPVLSRRQELGTRETEILTRWAKIDAFLGGVAERLDSIGGSGTDPPISFAWIPAILIAEATEELLASEAEAVNRQGLWFLVMTYLDARHEPRYWYSLDDDEASWLRWMFSSEGDERDEDNELAPRELVALCLLQHAGRAPDWFQPMPEA